jgi:hypothetical protein
LDASGAGIARTRRDIIALGSRKSSNSLQRKVGVVFMRVISTCAHQVRPPLETGHRDGMPVIWDLSRPTGIGILLGLGGEFALTGVLKSTLFGVTPSDTVTFASAALILGTVALVASVLPAWRAARIDPMAALRRE